MIGIDGLDRSDSLIMLGAVGVDADDSKHSRGRGATENAATVRALLDNPIDRGLDPKACRLLIIDSAKVMLEGRPPHLAPVREGGGARLG